MSRIQQSLRLSSLGSRGKSGFVITLLVLAMVADLSTSVRRVEAVDSYTSLTYNGQIDLSFEEDWSKAGYTAPGKAQITFTLILDRPYGSNELSGTVIAKGTLSGTTTDARPFTGCSGVYQVTATFTTSVNAVTSFQAGTIDLSGGGVRNFVGATSPVIQPGYGCFGGGFEGTLNNILISSFISSTQQTVTNGGWDKFPIQGGTQTLAKGSSGDYKSISGTATLTLVDSKKKDSFDFSIAVTPAENKVTAGGSAVYAISVSTVKGEAAPVTLSFSGINELTANFDKGRGTPPFKASLTVLAEKPGRYTFQVVGTSGDLRRTSNNVTLIVEGCPEFTIRPTMPPESDPRGFATPDQDSAAFRFNIFWGGATPVQAAFQTNIGGGSNGGTITPKFVFNPATLTTKLTNVIMEATTKLTPKGTYPITVTASVKMSNSDLTCTSNTQVSLVVGPSITDFKLIARAGQVQVTRENPTPAGGPAVVVKTGNNGSATLTSKAPATSASDNLTTTTTIDVGKNSEVRQYSNVINIGDEIDDEIIQKDLQDSARYRDQGLVMRAASAAWKGVDKIGPTVVTSIKQQLKLDLASKALKALGCALASSGTNNQEPCSGIKIYITKQGQLHFYRTNEPMTAQQAWDIILHDYYIVIPLGTDLIMNSQPYGNSSLTVIDGSAVVINLISGQTQMVNASQRLDMITSVSGNSTSTRDYISNIDRDSILQWWEARLSFPVTADAKQYAIGMRTNSTVKNVLMSKENNTISFTVSGASGTKGYVNITWQKTLLNGTSFTVTMDGRQIPFMLKQIGTNYSLFTSYTHSQHSIVITAAPAVSTSSTTTTTSNTSKTITTSSTQTSTSTTTTSSAVKSTTTSIVTTSTTSTTVSSSSTTVSTTSSSSTVTSATLQSSSTAPETTSSTQATGTNGLPSEVLYGTGAVALILIIGVIALALRRRG